MFHNHNGMLQGHTKDFRWWLRPFDSLFASEKA